IAAEVPGDDALGEQGGGERGGPRRLAVRTDDVQRDAVDRAAGRAEVRGVYDREGRTPPEVRHRQVPGRGAGGQDDGRGELARSARRAGAEEDVAVLIEDRLVQGAVAVEVGDQGGVPRREAGQCVGAEGPIRIADQLAQRVVA